MGHRLHLRTAWGLLFALDLDYAPDPADKVFQFGPPRAAMWHFPLPAYLHKITDVFRLEAEGISDVQGKPQTGGIRINDRASRVAIYLVTSNKALRAELEAKRQRMVQEEASTDFDPARSDADFAELVNLLGAK